MAGDWIKMRVDLPDDPAVIGIAIATGLSEDTVVGKLHRLWAWANQQTIDGVSMHINYDWIDRYLRHPGFAQAMEQVGWLEFKDGFVIIPKFWRHNGESAKQRALDRDRQAASRYNRDKCHAAGVTKDGQICDSGVTNSGPREEKRREEKRRDRTTPSSPSEGGTEQATNKKPYSPEDAPIPEALDTPEFRESWAQWHAYRRERNLPRWKESTVKFKLAELARWGPAMAVEAIAWSISNGWAGLFRPRSQAPPVARPSVTTQIDEFFARRNGDNHDN